MDDTKQVHVVRHGEVNNPTGVLYGRAPGFHLSQQGRRMAERLGEWFTNVPFELAVSSPLERALETMEPIVAGHDLDVETDQRIIEADNKLAGQVFGKHNKAILNPRNWRYFINPFTPSWGEPYAQIAARMQAAITDTAARLGAGGQAVMVSHQLPIWMARLDAEGARLWHDPRRRQCILASVTTFRFNGERCVGVTYAEPARDLLRENGNKAFSSGS